MNSLSTNSSPIVNLAADAVRLRVRFASGAVAWESFPSSSIAQAISAVQRKGGTVLEVHSPERLSGRALPSSTKSGRRQFDLLLFSQELLALLRAGLHLAEALSTLHAKAKPGMEARVFEHIVNGLKLGRNFSEVLVDSPYLFPEVYVATVRSSEKTGNLPQALERFITYQQQFDVLRKKVVAAAIYPALLLAVGFAVVVFLLGFVVPRFASVYESSGRDLPLLSMWMLAIGRMVNQHLGWVVTGFAVFLFCVFLGFRSATTKASLQRMVFGLPGIAPQVRLFRLTRFYRALGLLLGAGIPLGKAIGAVGNLLGRGMSTQLTAAIAAVQQGQPFSRALVDNSLASPIAESLVKVGERSGQMAEMLERTAQFHDEELSRWIDAASRLLEPVLMLLIGLVIGTVVVLMYLPIFDLAGSIR